MAWLLVFAKGKQLTVKEKWPKANLPTSAFQALRQTVRGYVTIRPCKTVLQVQLCRLISLSIVVSIVFSYIVFKEKLSVKSSIGLVMIIAGTLVKPL